MEAATYVLQGSYGRPPRALKEVVMGLGYFCSTDKGLVNFLCLLRAVARHRTDGTQANQRCWQVVNTSSTWLSGVDRIWQLLANLGMVATCQE